METATAERLPTRAATGDGLVKSSLSLVNSNCVEVVSLLGGVICVRNSCYTAGAVLSFTSDEWHAFLDHVTNDKSDCFSGLE